MLKRSESEKLAAQPADDALQLARKRQLAKLLGVNAWTLDHWRKKGLIPQPVILSPQVLGWRRADISKWLSHRQAKPVKTRVVRRSQREASHD